MTERMENTLRHIKTSVDVDPWAVDEVERVFKAVEDIKTEIDNHIELMIDIQDHMAQAIRPEKVLEIIDGKVNA